MQKVLNAVYLFSTFSILSVFFCGKTDGTKKQAVQDSPATKYKQ